MTEKDVFKVSPFDIVSRPGRRAMRTGVAQLFVFGISGPILPEDARLYLVRAI